MSFLVFCTVACSCAHTTEAPQTGVLVGVSYFAGWWEATPNKWQGPDGQPWLARFPERTPLLGAYNTQETMNREIVAAAKYGVDFFSILWYYSPPGVEREPHCRELNRGVSQFMRSPEAARMHFMIEFCNHPPYAVSTEAEWDECVAYWVQCFAHPSYLRVDGRPVFKIHSGHYFWKQNGEDWARCGARLDRLRAAVRQAGLGELCIGAGVGGHEPVGPEHWASKYFDFTGSYMDVPEASTASASAADDRPYAELATFVEEGRSIHKADAIPYMPVVGAGWCPRPWGDPRPCYAAPGNKEWEKTLRRVKADLLENEKLGLRSRKAFTIYAWNEFGEGGIVAPTKGEDLKKLKAIRKVFGKRMLLETNQGKGSFRDGTNGGTGTREPAR